MSGQATRVAHVAHPIHATRNNSVGMRNHERNADATASGHLSMTASELRAQLRTQQQRNRGVALTATKAAEVAPEVAHFSASSGEVGTSPVAVPPAQQAAQQHEAASIASPYENRPVARCMHRVLPNATDGDDQVPKALAVVHYSLLDAKGGTLIDPTGPESAIRELYWRFGDRVDWPALLATFEARERLADQEAATLIRRLMADSYRRASGR